MASVSFRTFRGRSANARQEPGQRRVAGRRTAVLLLAAAALTAWWVYPAAPVQAQSVLVSNLGQGSGDFSDFSNDTAQAFTTGSNSFGYTLTSVELVVATGASFTGYSVKLYAAASDGKPTESALATLSVPSGLGSGTDRFSAPGSGVALAANTEYVVVVDFPAGASTGMGTIRTYRPTR